MSAFTLILLALRIVTVLSDAVPSSSPSQLNGTCLAWGNNTITTVFYDCCKDVTLERSPKLALTALCPNRGGGYDPVLYPQEQYTFSRLQMDECLHLEHGMSLVTADDVPPGEVLQLEDINTACDAATFTLVEDPPTLQGTCGIYAAYYPLDFLILSSRGVLTCGGFSRGTPSGSLDETCCNIALNTDNQTEPTLTAICQTNRLLKHDCTNLEDTDHWRATNISLSACSARQSGPGSLVAVGQMADCTARLLVDEGVVLSVTCGSQKHNASLGDFVRNEYGKLVCYDFRGT